MSDLGDTFKAIKAERKLEKARRLEATIPVLNLIGDVDFRILSPYHYRLCTDPEIDFWPSTGKWIELGTNKKGHCMDSLLQYLKASGQLE